MSEDYKRTLDVKRNKKEREKKRKNFLFVFVTCRCEYENRLFVHIYVLAKIH